MINLKHNGMKLLLGLIIMIIMNIQLLSWWYVNGSGNAYNPPPSPGFEVTGTVSIETEVARGAGYFLEAYADTLLFMNQVELSNLKGMDYNHLQSLLDNALKHMTQANATYTRLKAKAEYTPYNPVVIEALRNLNYEEFGLTRNLNREIFAEVQTYLAGGSVTEMYGKLISDMEVIIKLITLVKENIDNGQFPSTPQVRQLNQAFSVSLLFGQYVAEVFEALGNDR